MPLANEAFANGIQWKSYQLGADSHSDADPHFLLRINVKGLENDNQNKYHRKWLLALNTIEC